MIASAPKSTSASEKQYSFSFNLVRLFSESTSTSSPFVIKPSGPDAEDFLTFKFVSPLSSRVTFFGTSTAEKHALGVYSSSELIERKESLKKGFSYDFENEVGLLSVEDYLPSVFLSVDLALA
jgi:hypothetical protein